MSDINVSQCDFEYMDKLQYDSLSDSNESNQFVLMAHSIHNTHREENEIPIELTK